jgi:hypothetical protein
MAAAGEPQALDGMNRTWGMDTSSLSSRAQHADATRHRYAWLLLVAVLAIHVLDEAMTDFLGFYNPLVLTLRARLPWFPMPTFTFPFWLAGLGLLVLALALLGPAVYRGATGTRLASWAFATIMLLNGSGHLGGSLYFQRWLPGTTSAPLVIAASIWLARRTAQRVPAAA